MSEEKQFYDEIDMEELTKLLDEEQKPKRPRKRKDSSSRTRWIDKFVRELEIEPGPFKVPTYVIYYQFVQWSTQTWAKRCSKIEFFRGFNKQFEQKRSGSQRYYMLNDSLELSEEIYEKAKKYQEMRQRKRKI